MQNTTVILSAVNYGYRLVMMNWVCNLRRLDLQTSLLLLLTRTYISIQLHGALRFIMRIALTKAWIRMLLVKKVNMGLRSLNN